MSRIGLALCVLYAVLMGLCVWGSMAAEGDPKGAFVLLQLPLAMQLGALDWLGVPGLSRLSWTAAYALIGLPTFALLYGAGWALGRLGWMLRRTPRRRIDAS